MPKLPKFDIPGHAHFVTTKVNRFMPLFLAHDFCRILLDNFDYYRRKHGFKLLGYVIILDHFHALIFPQNDLPISRILQDIKRYTAKQIRERLMECPTSWDALGGLVISSKQLESAYQTPARRCLQNLHVPILEDFQVVQQRTKNQEHQFWQQGFYDFNVYSESKLHEKLNYMHNNPANWNLVDDSGSYLYSSYQNFLGNDNEELQIEIDWL